MKSLPRLVTTLSIAVIAPACGTTGGAVLPPCVDTETVSAESCRAELVGEDHIGGLRLGMTYDAIVAMLGPPAETSEAYEEGATGYIVRSHLWPSVGVNIDTSRTNELETEEAYRIHVNAPFSGKTARNIGIGSSENDVQAAYAGTADPDHTRPGDNFVAGSIYGGIIFTFTAGRVSSVFIGAAAE